MAEDEVYQGLVQALYAEAGGFSTWLSERTQWCGTVHHHLSLVQEALRLSPGSPVEREVLVQFWLQGCSSALFVCDLAMRAGCGRVAMVFGRCISTLSAWLRMYGVEVGEEAKEERWEDGK